jgi:hypothetical protein
MSSRYRGFKPPKTSLCRGMGQRRRLPIAFETACIPLGPEDVSWQKIYLSGFSIDSHHQNWLEAVCGTLDSGRLANLFAGLEPAGVLLSGAFCRRKSWWCLTLIWMPYVHPSTQNGTGQWQIHPQDLWLILPPPVHSHLEKWRFKWIDGYPTA